LSSLSARSFASAKGKELRLPSSAARTVGATKSLSQERVAELHRRVAAGEKKAHLAREMGISRETLYQYLKPAPV